LRYAIISDIHSNIQALEAVVKEIERIDVDGILCLGDIVGYGARPSECISVIREECQVVLLGNHDAAAVGKGSSDNFNSMAKAAVDWTRDALTPDETDYLRGLPLIDDKERFALTHATFSNPESWDYIFSEAGAASEFDSCDVPLLFFGHTHRPVVFALEGRRVKSHHVGTFALDEQDRYIINVGSAGQPRDGNSDSCFLTLDLQKREIEYHRVPYDIKGAQDDILEAGLPKELAMRLSVGR